jgi:ATP-dependent Clp protease protease subunit
MSQSLRIGLIIGAFLVGMTAAGGMLLQAGLVLFQIVKVSDIASDLPDTLEMYVDQQIDAGHEDPILHSDDPLLSDRKILLGHDINARTAKDVAARLLYLNSVDTKQPIDVYISTQGGWSDNAFTIIDAMRLIEAPVNTWAVGGCYSAGALILTAGTGRRIATDNAIIMVHTNLDDSSEEFSYDRLALTRYENVWKKTADLPDSWYPMTSEKRLYLNAEEARNFKVIDEIVTTWSLESGRSSD